jgi:ABC-type bacteriocin/lantibiotic exporter with double-glycine peptidase domain
VDVATEAAIMRNLRALGSTLIVISHRPEVWNFGDKTIEIDGGEMSVPDQAEGERLSFA